MVKRTMAQGLGQTSKNPGTLRPETKGDEHKSFDTRTGTDFDPKGQKQVTGYVPGRNFKKKSSVEIAEDVKQASQEAPEAIDRQRIPKAASDMAKGYFENLGGQKK
jgi:hypothetical protein